ncbi:MAG: hypothetical protein E6J06_05415 [Chloroflexi bacterium]|nr:MAG: hypothetical protein E6J06_05415 [Chloroflexota bacterium]
MAESQKRRRRLRVAVALSALVLVAAAGVGAVRLLAHSSDNPGCVTLQRAADCTRILFLGNSYTSVNDLPVMFANLAWSGGHRVETAMQAPGGWGLSDHDLSQDTPTELASKPWDFAVLQEQSQIPSVESFRQAQMYPAARDLVGMIRAANAKPIFFVTWARQGGWPEYRMPDYASMQSSIDDGYSLIARELQAALAPVGYAWMARVTESLDPDLWQDDGSHPSIAGTYLAACVFYARIFGQSPVGLPYDAGLDVKSAAQLQQVAFTTVLSDPSIWGTL